MYSNSVFSAFRLLLVFLILCAQEIYGGKTLNRKGNSHFINFAKPLLNRVLFDEANILEKTEVDDELVCATKCLNTEGCKSYNFGSVSEEKGDCETLREDRFTSEATMEAKTGYRHVGIQTPCEQSPCKNGAPCTPLYDDDKEFFCNCTSTGLKGKTCSQACTVFDFESGLTGWIKTGTVFNNQPTFGDNPTARNREPSNHQGDWWIGGAEDRPSPSHPAGALQWDAPQGTLTSPTFTLEGHTLRFMIGGGCDVNVARAELLVEGNVVFQATGNCYESMVEQAWDVKAYHGKTAQLRLIDSSSGGWAHINFDNLREICS